MLFWGISSHRGAPLKPVRGRPWVCFFYPFDVLDYKSALGVGGIRV